MTTEPLPAWVQALLKAKANKNTTREELKTVRAAGLRARHTRKLQRTT